VKSLATNSILRSPNGTRLSIGGRIAIAEDSDWGDVRAAWNLAADQRPFAVALAQSADDVSKVIAFARDNGLRVAPQSTGHGAMALGPLDDVILLKIERMRGSEVEDATARVEAGVWPAEVGEGAAKSGRSFLPGTVDRLLWVFAPGSFTRGRRRP
jgi:FAD/FMN-containing dehydrogenase